MKDSDWRYVVDAILYVCLGGMTLIGIMLWFVLPAGPVAAESAKYFLGLHRHQWGNIHAYLSMVFVLVMIVHLVLNWKWTVSKTRQIFKRSGTPALAAIAFAPVFILFLFWTVTPKDSDRYREYGLERHVPGYAQTGPVTGRPGLPGGAAGGQMSPAGTDTSDRPRLAVKTDRIEEPSRNIASLDITGRTALREIERATGVSGRAVADRLGLPPAVSLDEPLGRLRRQYGFEIQAVRDIVSELIKGKN